MAYPFMPMTTKTFRKVSGGIKDFNLSEKSTKINGGVESGKDRQALETNSSPLKKIHPHSRTHNHY